VRIDVEVTDKSGKPIKGLKESQFEVSDDGKRQAISSFSYADIESIETASADDAKPIIVPLDNEGPNTASAEAASEPLQNRRLLVLFFDLTSMQTDDLIRAHDAAEKFVKTQMTKADVVAIVAFSTRLNVLANFTNDHAVLEKAIAQLTPIGENALSSNLYAAAANGEYDVQEYTGAAYTADETEFNVFNTDQKLAAVEGLANVLGGIPGRKAMVEFTGGITLPTPRIAPTCRFIRSTREDCWPLLQAETRRPTLQRELRCSRERRCFIKPTSVRIPAIRWRRFRPIRAEKRSLIWGI